MPKKPKHPGQYVRETYLRPQRISVKKAAELLGISRPGVSNFLNGRVSATENIATRIELVFGYPAAGLLRMQAEYDAASSSPTKASAETKAYVPPFLDIKANEIQDWAADNISARIRLSVFLRTLVNSTGLALKRVDFPGNDDAERPGWDGFTETSAGTPWIPEGKTGWEFGVTEKIKKKADDDFGKSVKGTPNVAERAETTFIFVTPRRWAGKIDWVVAMRATKQWRDVRAYDASDLEQWLEQSPAAQAWFAGETQRPSEGVRSLDRCWSDWTNAANPHLAAELFDTAKSVVKPKIVSMLAVPAEKPLIVSADSKDEALAAIAQTFSEPDLVGKRDRVLVFDRPGSLTKLAHGNQDFIAIVHTREVERELGPFASKLRAIVVYPKNALNDAPDVTLETLTHEAFRKGLEAMSLDRDQIERLGEESGHSLTVLRRRLSNVPTIRTPNWAADSDKARWLVPFVLLGAWNAENEADKTAVTGIAGDEIAYDEMEIRIGKLVQLEDAPLWSIGDYRGVVSKLDSLFAIAQAVTLPDLRRFLGFARTILGEDDPSLELPEKERWLAGMRGKRRAFSTAVRNGVAETLVLLAIHGKELFRRIGFDGEMEVSRLVKELLLPLTTHKLEANSHDLRTYAEAAPETFLQILEDDLRGDTPAVLGLIRPADTTFFGANSSRPGLLWALEGLAWSPQTFLRSVLILARLAEIELNDNLANKPISSLKSIFRSWMPQTAVEHDRRVLAIKKLFEKHPAVAWTICVDQFDGGGHSVGHYTHKPKWRPDGYGYGEPFKLRGPSLKFQVAMVELALSRATYSVDMVCDLVERLHALDNELQQRVWNLIDTWRKSGKSDADVAQVREKIRVTVLSRRAERQNPGIHRATLTDSARKVYAELEPADLVQKHAWLFKASWIEESADEIWGEATDYQERQKRIDRMRADALSEVYRTQGFTGVFNLASQGNAQGQIGWHMVRDVLANGDIASFIIEAMRLGSSHISPERTAILRGALVALKLEDREALLDGPLAALDDSEKARLLLLAPFDQSTWRMVDRLKPESQKLYWMDVQPSYVIEPRELVDETVERFLKAKRPKAAFTTVRLAIKNLRHDLIVDLLNELAQVGDDNDQDVRLDSHDVKEVFERLSNDPGVSLEDKAKLEFAYIDVLADVLGNNESHIGNLERYIEMNPLLWVEALAWAYKRKSGGEDPPSFRTPDGRSDLAERGYRLLEGMRRIPGLREEGAKAKASLAAWVQAVRTASAEIDRLEICDINLGGLFAHAPVGADGVWPCETVRDEMEELNSREVFDGAHTGIYNLRGVVVRGEGGAQERELAAKYRGWGEALRYTHPHLSSSLLMAIAKTYEKEAEREDADAGIRRRLRR
ncbi:MAG: HigA family addiction module antidote protein [Alphaproteobacteria bacterium]|nr:HigA family addiction module antidote protein [Alphaproteobacteria bacterium]